MEKYSGVKLALSYTMRNVKTGDLIAKATSTHCFMDKNGRPLIVKKASPAFDAALAAQLIRG